MENQLAKLMSASVLNERTEKIFKYIEAYNQMDVENMIADFSDDIIFQNVMNGEKTMELLGIDAFKKQAIEALSYFSERHQSIEIITHSHRSTEISIAYRAIAAMDFPNGLKKGDEINLQGKSIFAFSADGKISRLTDIS
ncbi:nuclear transport factor 2 family protein [Sphingobacterium sp. InxBP1]|uniref:nuclear transport factor 2 family protein n=1 Tax=Sphingobacterium sp. InxBP1 TaxID=2870328 RepID=UPI002244EB5E|nr:nuclear transport factor 2 family protein [Sphingobacterium sp. InxBP1]MCW8313500.1 nuclear transport factor 2 family protein [Sphingobacterium sp. InxBP1]